MITVYTKNNCQNCDKAKLYLETNNIDFTVINIEEDAEARTKLINEGHRSVPQIYEDDVLIGGLNELRNKYGRV